METTKFCVEMLYKGRWVELPFFRADNAEEAQRGAEGIHMNPDPARVVKMTVTRSAEVIWEGK